MQKNFIFLCNNAKPLFTEGFQNWIDTYNRSKILQKVGYRLIVVAFFFCYAFFRKRGDFVTIEEYIKGNDKFSRMPFATVYAVIIELIADGYVDASNFELAGDSGVAVCVAVIPVTMARNI